MPDEILPSGFVIASAMMKLLYVAIQVLLWWGLLRLLDIVGRLNFGTDIIALLKTNAVAASIYFGCRALAAAWIVSRFAIAGLAIGLGAIALAPRADAASLHDARYDPMIQRAVDHYWLDFPDWRMLKAQLWQESRFDVAAVSPAGARGIAQFMPATWREVTQDLGRPGANVNNAEIAIEAAAYYMMKQRRFPDWRGWADPDRHRMAQAAYNAGAGNIRKALRRSIASQRAPREPPIISHEMMNGSLPLVTGRHARETITYVRNIAKWRARLAS